MKRRSELMGKSIESIFTKEVYERLLREESFGLNLDTMQLYEIPEEIMIPDFTNVTFRVTKIKGTEVVIIRDFLDIVFDYAILSEGYEKTLNAIMLTSRNK